MGTKEKLLAAAVEVFGEKGFSGASTREIAARAGVNPVSLFRLFAGKEELYAAALEYVYAENQVEEHLVKLAAEPLSIKRFITTAIASIFDDISRTSYAYRLVLFAALEGGEEVSNLAWDHLVRKYCVVEKRIREGIRSGELRKVNSFAAARLIVSAATHYYQLSKLHCGSNVPSAFFSKNFAEHYADIIATGLRSGRTSKK